MAPKKFCQSRVRDKDLSLLLYGNQVLKSARQKTILIDKKEK